jgi:GT2 family glycosyltransferase
MSGTWCVQYTLPERRIDAMVDRADYHSSVRALVVSAGDPLGYVEFDLPAGPLEVDEVERRAREQLGELSRVGGAGSTQPGTPFVSVIVCTRNRPDEIARCLARLSALDYPNYEILVVDNAPTDDRTRVAVDAARTSSAADIKYVVEPAPGLSRARNRGIAAMRGAIAAYTDDDVAVDPHWLTEIVRAFAGDEATGCVTGMVCTADIPTSLERYFDARAQNWSARLETRSYSLDKHDLGALFPYTPGKFGTGANFAFRKQALDDMVGFDVVLGAGTVTGGGEDLDAFVRVLLNGYGITYSPRAIVWHHHRAGAAELRRQMFAWGVGLGSFVLAHLWRRETRGLVLRRIGSGFAQLFRTVRAETKPAKPPKQASADTDHPRGLMVLEVLGMLLSPVYYVRSRRRAGRARTAS